MSNSAITTVTPDVSQPRHPAQKQISRWESLCQGDAQWLMLLSLIIAAFLLGGCHARSGCCHAQSGCDTAAGDGVLAAFYLFYIIGWIIVSAAEG